MASSVYGRRLGSCGNDKLYTAGVWVPVAVTSSVHSRRLGSCGCGKLCTQQAFGFLWLWQALYTKAFGFLWLWQALYTTGFWVPVAVASSVHCRLLGSCGCGKLCTLQAFWVPVAVASSVHCRLLGSCGCGKLCTLQAFGFLWLSLCGILHAEYIALVSVAAFVGQA